MADPAPLEPLGRFDARAIPEASGIVKSRRHPGIFWVHNDSGNAPLLFAVRGDGRIVRRFRLAIPNLDWEDIAIDDQGHLYLGDIGNNAGLLRVRTIYRLDEPDPSSPEGGDRDARWPPRGPCLTRCPASNRFDAEGLFYDRGTAILVAKYRDGREAELFAVPIDPPPAGSGTGARPSDRPAAGLHGARHGRRPERGRHATGGLLVRGDAGLPARRGGIRGSCWPRSGTRRCRSRGSPGTGAT